MSFFDEVTELVKNYDKKKYRELAKKTIVDDIKDKIVGTAMEGKTCCSYDCTFGDFLWNQFEPKDLDYLCKDLLDDGFKIKYVRYYDGRILRRSLLFINWSKKSENQTVEF